MAIFRTKSNFDAFCDGERFAFINAEIFGCRPDILVTEEMLAGAQVLGFTIDVRRLRPPHGVRRKSSAVLTRNRRPILDEAAVLHARQRTIVIFAVAD